ncbi:unnamed protein product [Sphagnum tenellum]
MPLLAARGGLKTYYLDNHEVNRIHFYRDGEVVLSTRLGWIEKSDYYGWARGLLLNHDVRRSTKLNLSKGGHFFIGTGKKALRTNTKTIDVYVDLALGDVSVGEAQTVKLYETQSGVTYHNVRTMTACFAENNFPETITVSFGQHHTENNPYGDKVAEINRHLKVAGLDRNVTGIESIIKDRALLDLLLAANNLLKE